VVSLMRASCALAAWRTIESFRGGPMEKLCYLVRQARAHPGARLREALIEKAAPRLRSGGALHVQVSVDDEAVSAGEAVRLGRLDPPSRALVPVLMEDADPRTARDAALAASPL